MNLALNVDVGQLTDLLGGERGFCTVSLSTPSLFNHHSLCVIQALLSSTYLSHTAAVSEIMNVVNWFAGTWKAKQSQA